MTQLSFSTGTLLLKRLDLPNQPVALMGILSEITLTFERQIHTTRGSEMGTAIAAASGELTFKGVAKNARLQASSIGNMFFGPTAVPKGGMIELAAGEDTTVPDIAQVTVVNAATFKEDFGAFYASGTQLVPVATTPSQDEYQLLSPGVYLFSDHDIGQAVTIYYSYTTIVGQTVIIANNIYGGMPFFELILKQNGIAGGKDLIVGLNNCFSSKLALPFVNQRYAVTDFDFQAISDLQSQIGSISLAE